MIEANPARVPPFEPIPAAGAGSSGVWRGWLGESAVHAYAPRP
jgi:hypothetical protein